MFRCGCGCIISFVLLCSKSECMHFVHGKDGREKTDEDLA